MTNIDHLIALKELRQLYIDFMAECPKESVLKLAIQITRLSNEIDLLNAMSTKLLTRQIFYKIVVEESSIC